jgi:D-glycero-D-manno-heptose 1,7-bisphosphate phosphatase
VTALRPAVFLDRDGTIIQDVSYIRDVADVRLLPGAAQAIARLNAAGVRAIIVTNQSGLGRGYFSFDDFQRVQARMEELLGAAGARIDATYVCPHSPRADEVCQCRKPGTLLFRTAAQEHGLDPACSWYIGDRWRDIAAAQVLGGRGILLITESTPEPEVRLAAELDPARFDTANSLAAAIERVLASI